MNEEIRKFGKKLNMTTEEIDEVLKWDKKEETQLYGSPYKSLYGGDLKTN